MFADASVSLGMQIREGAFGELDRVKAELARIRGTVVARKSGSVDFAADRKTAELVRVTGDLAETQGRGRRRRGPQWRHPQYQG